MPIYRLTFFRDLYLGFGPPEEVVWRCIRRAYRDFNRTWPKDAASDHERTVARTAGEEVLADEFIRLQGLNAEHALFDAWHAKARQKLMDATRGVSGGGGLTLGQAQKWINMSVKYAVGGRVFGLERFEPVAHVPIDRVLLEALAALPGFEAALAHLPRSAWSKLSASGAYEAFQHSLRNLAAPTSPLALEFSLWLASRRR